MKTKTAQQIQLSEKCLHPIIQIYYEFANLKHLYRQGWLARDIPTEQCESVAEHTLGVALAAMFLADLSYPDLDPLKIIRMALIHDFGEIYAGDIIPTDQIPSEEKSDLEKEAVIQIFKGLPNGGDYLSLWEEFEKGTSPEARIVRQIDKLEMALQASIYEKLKLGDLPEFFHSARKEIHAPELVSIIKELETLRD